MAATPNWKVVNPKGEYIASFKHVEDAAVLIAFYGDGAKLYDGVVAKRALVWTEGADGVAAESYDSVAQTVHARVHDRLVKMRAPAI